MRVVMGISFAAPVKALWRDQAVRGANSARSGWKYACETSGKKRTGISPEVKASASEPVGCGAAQDCCCAAGAVGKDEG